MKAEKVGVDGLVNQMATRRARTKATRRECGEAGQLRLSEWTGRTTRQGSATKRFEKSGGRRRVNEVQHGDRGMPGGWGDAVIVWEEERRLGKLGNESRRTSAATRQ